MNNSHYFVRHWSRIYRKINDNGTLMCCIFGKYILELNNDTFEAGNSKMDKILNSFFDFQIHKNCLDQ
jgi:hypothetical protein